MNGLSIQGQSIQSHRHNMNHGHGVYDGKHAHSVYLWIAYGSGKGIDYHESGHGDAFYSGYTDTVSSNISVYDYNGDTGYTGDAETRPNNFTYRIWKRIS